MGWDGMAARAKPKPAAERRGEKRFFLILFALWGTVVEDSGSHSEGKKGDAIGRLVRIGILTNRPKLPTRDKGARPLVV